MPLRRLIWLLALWAFVLPSAFLPAVASSANAHVAMSDCPYHASAPAEHHQDKHPAKHGELLCCLVMSHSAALLPMQLAPHRAVPLERPAASAARDLTGISPTKELPPPRV